MNQMCPGVCDADDILVICFGKQTKTEVFIFLNYTANEFLLLFLW